MHISTPIRLFLLLLLFTAVCLPLGHSEAIYKPPPIEKVKPIGKKKKSTLRKRKKYPKSLKKHPKQQQDVGRTYFVLTIIAFILLIVGAFLFGLGVYLFPLWVVGLAAMGVANFGGLSILLYSAGAPEKSGGEIIGVVALFAILLLMPVLDFIIGLSFLIWGLVIGLPFAWIVGLVLLAIFLAALIIIIFFIRKN